jgi:RNA polymerase sigma factor (sigma-70 family)
LLEHIRRAALDAPGASWTDAQLMEAFIARRDEAAFATLLRRHGPMVLGVCQRVIGNTHDVEDAFQATFLVLVRKAASIRPRQAVGNWLYGVAFRTALEARGRLARQRSKERRLRDVPQPDESPDHFWKDVQPLLDHELNRLSEKYRLPVVLCELEGRNRKEVARQLKIPEGTLSSRLAMARKLLAERLSRRGVALSVSGVGTLLTSAGASASVPASLLLATTRAAIVLTASQTVAGVVSVKVAALTDGVLKAMFIAKLKTTCAVLCGVAALGLGTGGLMYQARAGGADPDKDGTPVKLRQAQGQTDKDLRRALQEAREREEALRKELAELRDALQRERIEAANVVDRLQAGLVDVPPRPDNAPGPQDAQKTPRPENDKRTDDPYAQKAPADGGKTPRPENDKRAIDPGAKKGQNPFGQGQPDKVPSEKVTDLNRTRATIDADYVRQRRALLEQLRALDAEHQEALRALERRQNQPPRQSGDRDEGIPPGLNETLKRVLDRLDRMEQRLNQLEKFQKESPDAGRKKI